MTNRYVVVLPAKNEEQNIRDAVRSIASQTQLPEKILVVDDGSTDATRDIVRSMERQYPFVDCRSFHSSKSYELGGHVVRLFKEGKRLIDESGIDYDWIVKMDADLQCEPDFMSLVFERIQGRKVGVVSGTPYFEKDGARIYDTSPYWHTHGQFKIYNAKAFREYGGPREHLGWDCADNVRSISAGWDAVAIRDINYLMHREVGGKTSNKRGRINHGIGCYICGFGLGYFMLKVVHDVLKPPVVLGSIGLLRGYFGAAIRREEKVLSADQRRLLRKLLWSSIGSRFRNKDFVLLQKLNTKTDS